MRPSQALTALWAFASVSSGFLEETDEPQAFTMYQELSEDTYFTHPAIERLHTVRKFRGNASDDLVAAADAAQKGSVKNFPGRFDSYYLVPTRIGTPAQKVNLDFDTGSSDLWTYASSSPPKIKKGHSFYSPGKSKTAKKQKGQKWNILYGDNSTAGGSVYKDIVRLGPVAIHGQAVEVASHAKGSIAQEKNIDGIFGSGFTPGNQVKPKRQSVWFENARLKKKVFCAALNKGKPGAYDLGFINPKHYTGKVHYTPVSSSQGYWLFRTNGFKVGNGPVRAGRLNAIADTGTTVAMIPARICNSYYRNVRGARNVPNVGYVFPCAAKLPSLSLGIGGSQRKIAGKFINAGFAGTVGGRRFCFGGLQANTGLGGLSVLGDTFLKSQYTVFDFGKKRIGFAYR